MEKWIKEDSFLREAREARFQPNAVVQSLIFIAIFVLVQIALAIPVFFIGINTWLTMEPAISYVLTLSFFGIGTILVIVYCRFIEKRSLRSMGFVRKKAFGQYMFGLLLGLIMFSAALLICLGTGTLKYRGVVIGDSMMLLILFFVAFLVQGMFEEVLLRGYFMVSLSNKTPLIIAILVNSVMFAIIHLLNTGISVMAFINLILYGIFASVYMVKTNNLWGICAIHSMWNFTQGNLYGILVSGQNVGVSLFSFVSTERGELINGGAFGLEGGFAVTFVLVVATIATIFYTKKTDDIDAVTAV